MQRNTAGQKLSVYVFDSTTNLPKTGDAANLTAYVAKDDGSVTVLADTSASEHDATNAKGFYLFDLAQAETNADKLQFSCKSSTANMVCLAMPAVVATTPASFSAFVTPTAVLTTAMTESYSADGAAPTLAQALFMLIARLTESSISSTAWTLYKLDGVTSAAVLTLGDATNPTSVHRTT